MDPDRGTDARDGTVSVKLIDGKGTKARLAVGCVLILAAGLGLAPKRAPTPAPPQEPVAPILGAEVARRETGRLFEALQQVGRDALDYSVALPSTAHGEGPPVQVDYAARQPADPLPAAFGLVVTAQGDVLTHVDGLGGQHEPAVHLPDGRVSAARVTAYEPETGLVLLRLAAPYPAVPTMADASAAAGDLCVAAARWNGRDIVSPLFVTSIDGTYTLGWEPGASAPGTPVFTAAGAALAVTGGAGGRSIGHPVAAAVGRLQRARDEGRGLPSTIGVLLQPLGPQLAGRLGESGVVVADTIADGPAAQAGIVPGDVIVSIDGRPLQTADQGARRVAALSQGQRTPIVVRRRGKEVALEVEPQTTLGRPTQRGTAPPPHEALSAARAFPAADLAQASIPPGAWVLSIEGTPVTESSAPRILRRVDPPWLVWLQHEGNRFFAVVPGERKRTP